MTTRVWFESCAQWSTGSSVGHGRSGHAPKTPQEKLTEDDRDRLYAGDAPTRRKAFLRKWRLMPRFIDMNLPLAAPRPRPTHASPHHDGGWACGR
jgi:hypothetical protein